MHQYGYWCSWLAQNHLAERAEKVKHSRICNFIGDQGAKGARGMMNEENVFGVCGFAAQWEGIRKDLFLMLDDGWDVPYGAAPDYRPEAFGSLLLNENRFPFVSGTPEERLKALNERVKAAGWKGVGIWVAAQCSGKKNDRFFSDEDKTYWTERILQSRYAGIAYWKVDWGIWEHDLSFRKFISETAAKLYPGLVVEHAVCCPPLNGIGSNATEGLRGRFAGDKEISTLSEQAVKFSRVFRTYDVLPPHSVATTLDRAAHLLPFAEGYLNVEDEVYLAAALGCQMGIMRSRYGLGLDRWDDSERLSEVEAAVTWQRYAPPFVGGVTEVSDEILYDDYTYGKQETWFEGANGKRVRQGAPAVVSRNMALPVVEAGQSGCKPFVVSARHPNGTYSVAVLPRMISSERQYVGGKMTVEIEDMPDQIVLFGWADCFEFVLKNGNTVKSVSVESIIEGKNIDITQTCRNENRRFAVNKEIIKDAWQAQDRSAPSVICRIKYGGS